MGSHTFARVGAFFVHIHTNVRSLTVSARERFLHLLMISDTWQGGRWDMTWTEYGCHCRLKFRSEFGVLTLARRV